jgi:hypothetical protein
MITPVFMFKIRTLVRTKMKNKRCHNVAKVPKYNRITIETETKWIPLSYIYYYTCPAIVCSFKLDNLIL